MILSIIIPVYNVAPYLKKCLDSIVYQIESIDASQIEIVLLNDGSTDNSLEICKSFKDEFSFINLIDKSNSGLSDTRNQGLLYSKGHYIWFIDSDDWIAEGSLRVILNKLKVQNIDLLAISSSNFINGEIKIRTSHTEDLDTFTYLNSDKFNVGAVFYIYNSSIFNQFKFKTGIVHEDEEFNNKVLYTYQNIAFLEYNTYIVNQREGSITRSINPKRAFDLLLVIDSLYKFMNQEVAKEHQILFYNRISLLFNNALNNTFDMNKSTLQLFKQELNKYPYIFQCLKKSSVKKYQIEGYLMALFPKYSVLIYKILKGNIK
ncbi:glycosyltransferase family 2 protein [uncultured Tenacibaculum sp.]|uniref:glycosyltransferase family 2 protein n=1 Tax=uncultured Tenacibaculum sp. TaxID=174713 RepID=UPI00263805CF|nr:glycosyltransferase family 2 protein [uncultured Tenacibaculum sp.]